MIKEPTDEEIKMRYVELLNASGIKPMKPHRWWHFKKKRERRKFIHGWEQIIGMSVEDFLKKCNVVKPHPWWEFWRTK